MSSRTEKARIQKIDDQLAIELAIRNMGGLREPEICAATGIDEDRVYRACKVLVTCGTCVRRAADGELSIAPPWWAEAEQAFSEVA